jgi:hypothetical protein
VSLGTDDTKCEINFSKQKSEKYFRGVSILEAFFIINREHAKEQKAATRRRRNEAERMKRQRRAGMALSEI